MSEQQKNLGTEDMEKRHCLRGPPIFFCFVLQTEKIFTLGRKMGKYIYLFNMKGSTILLPVLGNKQILPEVSKVQTAGSLAPNHTSTKLQSQD